MKDTFNVIYNPQVYHDINSILNFYDFETKNNQIGKKFLEALKINLKNLKQNPKKYQIHYQNIRFIQIKPFPHLAHFRIDEINKIVRVEALFHPAQDSSNWVEKTLE